MKDSELSFQHWFWSIFTSTPADGILGFGGNFRSSACLTRNLTINLATRLIIRLTIGFTISLTISLAISLTTSPTYLRFGGNFKSSACCKPIVDRSATGPGELAGISRGRRELHHISCADPPPQFTGNMGGTPMRPLPFSLRSPGIFLASLESLGSELRQNTSSP